MAVWDVRDVRHSLTASLHHTGKTHAALEALKQASSGLYCGPLRLLAWDVSERLNQASLTCNLITGAVAPS